MNLKVSQIYASTSWFYSYGCVTLVGVVTLGKSTNPYKNLKLERVVSIESLDSPQCSTNVIGATPVGISEKGLVIESIFLQQSQWQSPN